MGRDSDVTRTTRPESSARALQTSRGLGREGAVAWLDGLVLSWLGSLESWTRLGGGLGSRTDSDDALVLGRDSEDPAGPGARGWGPASKWEGESGRPAGLGSLKQ